MMEEDVANGETGTCEDVPPLCSLPSAQEACSDGGLKYATSKLQPVEQGDAQKERAGEDSAADKFVDGSPAEPEGMQDPRSKGETKYLSTEEGEEKDGSRLKTVASPLEDVKPLLELAEDVIGDRDAHDESEASALTSKTAEVPGSGPPAQCEDYTAVNHNQSLPSNAENLAALEHSRHRQRVEKMLGDQKEKSSNCENVSNLPNAGDPAEEEQGVVGLKTQGCGTPSPDPQNPDVDSADLLKELSACLGQINISIEQPQADYSTYLSREGHMAHLEFGHIIEIYDFPAQLKTEDILEAFDSFRDKGFRIKWVDSIHALGLFSSPDSASEALSVTHSQLKTRPLSQATKQSKLKVARSSEFLQPVKERAQTNTVIAKRLVIRALGLHPSERKGPRDPKPKNPGGRKVQLHQKTEDGPDDMLDSAGNAGAE
ncbi:R3H and coiled-coil domain-containing protein 1-like isoform X2 [Heterodontus francisci]|uniref:R3H and coiled-coil domain-containing protein 1-like isoform X2 n=1 Tax=Heterodontus francisci TaxID=7792 RepID=UPI00355B2BE6